MICFANHKEGAEILLKYSSGTPGLDASSMREVDLHVERCAECRQLVAAQRTVFAALDDFAAPNVSADFDQKLYARIAAEKPAFWHRWLPVTPIVWWKPVVPVALAALALSALFVVRTSNSGSAQPQPVIGKADVEQVEQALDHMELLAPATSSAASSSVI
jgi:anti-sigma-K factor RskA